MRKTKRLILTRHAKSAWGDPSISDHDRSLNNRGREASPLVGAWLAEQGYVPDQVLCSTAMRTQETWALMAPVLAADLTPNLVADLYHASESTLLRVLQHATGQTVLVLSHNPGIGLFAQDIAQTAPDHPKFDQYPTAATLVVDFDIPSWQNLSPGTGQVQDFIVPRDLPGYPQH
ncbi:MAG: SixA phosphatase family protein [Mangrovicoccus sp.]